MSFADEHLISLIDEGLGSSSYLVDLGDGRSLAVDACWDTRALHEAAAERALTLAYAAETHLHADFLSGAVQLAHDDGASLLVSAAGRRPLPEHPARRRRRDRSGRAGATRAGHSRPHRRVRQLSEYAAAHVPGAVHIELGDLSARAADAPRGAVVACGHGERAMTAASLLGRAGRTDLTVLRGGPADYDAAHGQQLAGDALQARP